MDQEQGVKREISGWGRFPAQTCQVHRPETQARVEAIITDPGDGSLISRGVGASYGDAALNDEGAVLLHERLDRFLSFDRQRGRLVCEAGVTLAEILALVVPHGWFLPVTPGTRQVTVGGALAANVHGKNHHSAGAFAQHVPRFELATPAQGRLLVDREQEPEIFWATAGGMGLTGPILTVTLDLLPLETAWLQMQRVRAKNLEEALDLFARHDQDHTYSVAWIDCLARGSNLGRSVLMWGDHATEDALPPKVAPLERPGGRGWSVPLDLPSATLNSWTVRAFNAAYYRIQRPASNELVELDRFFYPLDAIEDWNRVYGRRGFIQYQAVLPKAQGHDGMRAMVEAVAASGLGSFLAVLKQMGPEDPGLLSFPMEGPTLALDLPRKDGLDALIRTLDRIVLDHGGRVYLAKDAMLDPATFEAMYPEAETFRSIKAKLDPDQRISSSLSRRIGLTSGRGGGA